MQPDDAHPKFVFVAGISLAQVLFKRFERQRQLLNAKLAALVKAEGGRHTEVARKVPVKTILAAKANAMWCIAAAHVILRRSWWARHRST